LWPDRSPSGNSALAVGAATIRPGAIGGKTAVHFDGTDYLVVADSPSIQFGMGDFVVAMVVQHTTPTSGRWTYGLLYGKQNVHAPAFPGFALVANSVTYEAGVLWAQVAFDKNSLVTTVEADFNDGHPFYVVVHRLGSNLSIRVNGCLLVNGAGVGYTVDVSAAGYALVIGGSDIQQDIVGDIAEVVAVKGATSASDIGNLEAYFKTKYGL
jgi:hypothetical protein